LICLEKEIVHIHEILIKVILRNNMNKLFPRVRFYIYIFRNDYFAIY